MNNILFFGDSLTAGYGLSNVQDESFPGLIAKKLQAERLDYKVINGGQSGDTSAGGLSRIDYWLNQSISIFILELGINDIFRGIPPSTTEKNLQAIVDKVKQKYPDTRMALMGMELPSFIPGVMVADFRAIFKRIAEKNNMIYVPFFLEGVAGKAHLNLQDGLHPSAAGYRIIAENVWPVLKTIL